VFKINGVMSFWVQVSSGVLQGSILGPLLFSLCVNELPSLVSSQLLMFVDDITTKKTLLDWSKY